MPWWWCNKTQSEFRQGITTAIAELNLTDARRYTLLHRYVAVVELYERLSQRVDRVYACLRAIVTIGSLVLPALLTLQRDADAGVYWGTFTLSLVVTVSNAIIELFALQKRSRVYWLTYKKLESEGWKYAQSVGKYSGQAPADTFATFVNNVETMCAAAVADISAITPLPQLQRGPSSPPSSSSAVTPPSAQDLEHSSSVAGHGVSTLFISSSETLPSLPSDPLES
jgi:hypothetical protein